MNDNKKIWLVTAQAVYQTISFLCAGDSAEEVETSIRGESGDMLVPTSITRYGAWLPDGLGGEFWAWAQDFSFDKQVAEAWEAEGRSYPG